VEVVAAGLEASADLVEAVVSVVVVPVAIGDHGSIEWRR
jgi:hypothetical protein